METDRLAWGIGFIVFGFLLMLFTFGVIRLESIGDAWKFWPLLFVVVGLALLFFTSSDKVEQVKEGDDKG